MSYAHLRDMLCSGAMARFTGNARNQLFRMKLAIRARGRAMTPKAQRRLVRGHAPAERSLDAISTKPWVSGGKVQPVYELVVAHPAFKIDSVLLIQKGVPELLVSEHPA